MWHVISSLRDKDKGKEHSQTVSGFKRALRNKSLIAGLFFLSIAFLLSLFAVLPRTYHISGKEIISNARMVTVHLNVLNDLGSRYGGLWGNMTFMSTSNSNLTLRLEHVNGTKYEETIFLSSFEPGTISIKGLIPKEMSFVTIEGSKANLTYIYDLSYYSYPASIFGILAAMFSILGAIFGFRGLFYHIMGIVSREEER